MSQHDYNIANQSAPDFRTDLNLALTSIVSQSSGSTAPSTTYANMLWYDTTTNILKMRNEADDAWVNVAYINQSTDTYALLDDTFVVNTSGTQTGLIGDQATAAWELGTSTTESLVSPAKVKSSIDTLGASLLNASGSAPLYACRAWVNFNGIGVVAIRASGNVSSITDNGTASYTINFATAMPDANYAAFALANGSIGQGHFSLVSLTTTSVSILGGVFQAYSPTDRETITVAVIR